MLTVVIQSGGQSRRMGQDKALLPFLGEPLILRVLRRVDRLADEILVTTNHPQDYPFLGVPLMPDVLPGRGALGGLYTALQAAQHPSVAVVACDMPFVNADLLAFEHGELLATQADLAIPQTPHGLEPFHAVYRRAACLPWMKEALDSGQWRVDAWLGKATVRYVTPAEVQRFDPARLAFWNINTPAELAKAERIARQAQP